MASHVDPLMSREAHQVPAPGSDGRWSRRRFLNRALAAGVALPLGAALAACGGNQPAPSAPAAPAPAPAQPASSPAAAVPSPAPAPAAPAPAASPAASGPAPSPAASPAAAAGARPARSGGRLVVTMPQSPSSLDPAFGINAPEYAINSWLYDNLVWLGPDLQLKPMVATEWTPNQDASVWTFKLRDDVKFTSGRKLVADDVVFSVTRILNPDTGSPGRSGLGPIDSVEAQGEGTVVFKLKSPYADFPLELSQRWGRIVPRDAADNLKTAAAGSGPFVLKEYVPGSHVLVARNPNHWDPNAGLVDEIMLRTIPDEVAEQSSLRTGESHIMFDVPVASYDQVARIDGVTVQAVPTGTWVPLIMRVDTKPFDNPKVREAVKWCIDRPQFVTAVLFGHGTPANDHNVPPNHPFAWDAAPRKRDIDKAKALLAEAGMPGGFEFDLVAATDRSIRADTAVTIQQMVKDAGIKFNVKTIDYDTYIAQVYKKGPLYIGYWGMRPTLDSQMVPFFTTNGSFNEYAYSNPALDDKLSQARAELNVDRRKLLYQEAQRMLSEEGPVGIPYFVNVMSAARREVAGFQVHPLTSFDLRYVSLQR